MRLYLLGCRLVQSSLYNSASRSKVGSAKRPSLCIQVLPHQFQRCPSCRRNRMREYMLRHGPTLRYTEPKSEVVAFGNLAWGPPLFCKFRPARRTAEGNGRVVQLILLCKGDKHLPDREISCNNLEVPVLPSCVLHRLSFLVRNSPRCIVLPHGLLPVRRDIYPWRNQSSGGD
jgi:hypothetical protein